MCGRCAVSFGGSGIPAARPFSGTIPRCQRLSASPAAEPRAENIGLRARRQRALRVQLGENSPGLQQQLRQMPATPGKKARPANRAFSHTFLKNMQLRFAALNFRIALPSEYGRVCYKNWYPMPYYRVVQSFLPTPCTFGPLTPNWLELCPKCRISM